MKSGGSSWGEPCKSFSSLVLAPNVFLVQKKGGMLLLSKHQDGPEDPMHGLGLKILRMAQDPVHGLTSKHSAKHSQDIRAYFCFLLACLDDLKAFHPLFSKRLPRSSPSNLLIL